MIAASAPKKTALVNECPLGKLYDSGGERLKNGIGLGRLNASLRVIFNNAAPIIVIAKSFASRFHLRITKRTTTKMVPTVKVIVEPTNENPRIIAVSSGEENGWTSARVLSSNQRASPSSASSGSQPKKVSVRIAVPRPSKSDRLRNSNDRFLFAGASDTVF